MAKQTMAVNRSFMLMSNTMKGLSQEEARLGEAMGATSDGLNLSLENALNR